MTIFETIFLATKYSVGNTDIGGVAVLCSKTFCNSRHVGLTDCQELTILTTLLDSDITLVSPKFSIAVIPFKTYLAVISVQGDITIYIDKKVKKMAKWKNKFQALLGIPVMFELYSEGAQDGLLFM